MYTFKSYKETKDQHSKTLKMLSIAFTGKYNFNPHQSVKQFTHIHFILHMQIYFCKVLLCLAGNNQK